MVKTMIDIAKQEIFIDGHWREGRGAAFASHDPSKGEVSLNIKAATAEDVASAVEAARKAWRGWALTPLILKSKTWQYPNKN